MTTQRCVADRVAAMTNAVTEAEREARRDARTDARHDARLHRRQLPRQRARIDGPVLVPKNTPSTEELREEMRLACSEGEQILLARLAMSAVSTTRHELGGSARMSADLLRAKLRTYPKRVAIERLTAWLFPEDEERP